jgi:hypothetical protein
MAAGAAEIPDGDLHLGIVGLDTRASALRRRNLKSAFAGVAQLARASACHAEGRRFDPGHPLHSTSESLRETTFLLRSAGDFHPSFPEISSAESALPAVATPGCAVRMPNVEPGVLSRDRVPRRGAKTDSVLSAAIGDTPGLLPRKCQIRGLAVAHWSRRVRDEKDSGDGRLAGAKLKTGSLAYEDCC